MDSARFSSEKLRIQGSWFLQVGHCFITNLQTVQMLWPVAHWVMGGVMYSKHTGHFSSLRISCWVGDNVIVTASPADSSPITSRKSVSTAFYRQWQ